MLPVDEFDASCRAHDATYARNGTDLATADLRFAAENFSPLEPKRFIAGVAVGAQGLLRYAGVLGRDNVTSQGTLSTNRKISKPGAQSSLLPWDAYKQSPQGQQASQATATMVRKNRVNAAIDRMGKLGEVIMRKTASPAQARASRRGRNKILAGEAVQAMQPVRVKQAPVALGNIVKSSRAQVRTTKQGIVVAGRDVVATVNQTSSTAWQLGALLPLHPAYYNGTALSNHCRAYSKYRWRGITFSFITKQPTSTTGQVVLSHRVNALEPAEDGAAGAFISRVMSRENSSMGPIWSNLSVDVVPDYKEGLIDAFVSDWADNVFGDMEVYVQSNSAEDAGYIMMDYEIEFYDTIVQPHLTSIPLPVSAVGQTTLTVAALTTPAAGWGLTITAPSLSATNPIGNGAARIFKVVFDLDLSTIGANAAFALTNPRVTPGATTVEYTSASIAIVLKDGYTAYAVTRGGNQLTLYSTYDHAQANSLGGLWVNAATATTTATTLYCRYYLVRFGEDDLPEAS